MKINKRLWKRFIFVRGIIFNVLKLLIILHWSVHFRNKKKLWTKIYTVNPETTWEQDGSGNLRGCLGIYYRDHGSNPVVGTRLRSPLGQMSKVQGSPQETSRRGRINYRKTSSWCSFLSCHIANTGWHFNEDFTDYSPFKIKTEPSKSVRHKSN